MTRAASALPDACAAAIVGGGPAGLSAAVALARAGVADVHVIEREREAGGIPRHCGHPPFGMREFGRVLTGPRYARRLAAQARELGVNIHTETTVAALAPGGLLELSNDGGTRELRASRVLLATGVRETPRAARLVSGGRPAGVTTTGALQSTVYLASMRPFDRPVIVGTELVSFSALLTCLHAGIAPVAMIETAPRVVAWRFSSALPRVLGVALHVNTRLERILGQRRVEGVQLRLHDGASRVVDCDGVVFSGRFVPEASLARLAHLAVDDFSGGPVVDNFGRCSDPAYHATGNLLRAVETAGWCWNEGRRAAGALRAALQGALPDPGESIGVVPVHPALKYAVPQRLARSETRGRIQLRVNRAVRGRLRCLAGERVLAEKRIDALPERRILLDVPLPRDLREEESLRIDIAEAH